MNIANKLTLFRIVLIPFFIIFLLIPNQIGIVSLFGLSVKVNILISMIIFIIASATDWFDGYLARKHNLVTDFGKFMDPLADKILVNAALICMVQLQWIPSWCVIVILTREFAVTGLRMLISQNGEVLAAKFLGKLKTTFQMFTLIVFFLFPSSSFATICLYLTVIITIYSGWDYFKNHLQLLKTNI